MKRWLYGKEFKGLDDLRGGWKGFLVPDWNEEVVTPALVGEIIDWCLAVEDVTSVDYKGEIISCQRIE